MMLEGQRQAASWPGFAERKMYSLALIKIEARFKQPGSNRDPLACSDDFLKFHRWLAWNCRPSKASACL